MHALTCTKVQRLSLARKKINTYISTLINSAEFKRRFAKHVKHAKWCYRLFTVFNMIIIAYTRIFF